MVYFPWTAARLSEATAAFSRKLRSKPNNQRAQCVTANCDCRGRCHTSLYGTGGPRFRSCKVIGSSNAVYWQAARCRHTHTTARLQHWDMVHILYAPVHHPYTGAYATHARWPCRRPQAVKIAVQNALCMLRAGHCHVAHCCIQCRRAQYLPYVAGGSACMRDAQQKSDQGWNATKLHAWHAVASANVRDTQLCMSVAKLSSSHVCRKPAFVCTFEHLASL
jgi:hypothetical protein